MVALLRRMRSLELGGNEDLLRSLRTHISLLGTTIFHSTDPRHGLMKLLRAQDFPIRAALLAFLDQLSRQGGKWTDVVCEERIMVAAMESEQGVNLDDGRLIEWPEGRLSLNYMLACIRVRYHRGAFRQAESLARDLFSTAQASDSRLARLAVSHHALFWLASCQFALRDTLAARTSAREALSIHKQHTDELGPSSAGAGKVCVLLDILLQVSRRSHHALEMAVWQAEWWKIHGQAMAYDSSGRLGSGYKEFERYTNEYCFSMMVSASEMQRSAGQPSVPHQAHLSAIEDTAGQLGLSLDASATASHLAFYMTKNLSATFSGR